MTTAVSVREAGRRVLDESLAIWLVGNSLETTQIVCKGVPPTEVARVLAKLQLGRLTNYDTAEILVESLSKIAPWVSSSEAHGRGQATEVSVLY
jgi:hypothetical protein